MSAAVAAEPSVIHAVPGRVRLHVPGHARHGWGSLEQSLRQLPGVESAEANTLTENVLVRFDPRRTSGPAILGAVRSIESRQEAPPPTLRTPPAAVRPAKPSAFVERHGTKRSARIAVRGLANNPALAHRVVERLERHPGVHARANPLTGRVWVEFTKEQVDLEDLLSDVADVEMPDLAGTDQPAHPLDPAPLIQSAARLIGATLGLGLVAARRLANLAPDPTMTTPASQAAGVVTIIQGIPPVRAGARRLLGRNTADLIFSGAAIVTQALSGNPLALLVSGGEALRLLTEVIARRDAWRRYEDHLGPAAKAAPGETVRLESGECCPRMATVVEGTGTAVGQSGHPVPLQPGARVPAGAHLYGGPFVLTLGTGPAFTTVPRPAALVPAIYDRYLQIIGPTSVAYAIGTALVTRSFSRAFTALLLVNPRTAMIGKDTADVGASARALRAGVTVVGTRPDRMIQLPGLLLLGHPRVVVDGFEVTGILPRIDAADTAELLELAAVIATAAGAPWGGAFHPGEQLPVSDAHFDGEVARAIVGGTRYSFGAAADDDIPGVALLRARGDTPLILRNEREDETLAIIALRPRLAPGVDDLVDECRRRGVDLAMLDGGNRATASGVARRAGVTMIAGDDAVAAIRRRQADGAFVACVSDSATDGAAFAACDLAIGVTAGDTGFAAPADLLAPDLIAVTTIIEAGARRNRVTQAAVVFSAAANVVGAIWGARGQPGVEMATRFVYGASLAALGAGWLWLRGGERPPSLRAGLVQPNPDRWGQRDPADVLRAFGASERGLSPTIAAERQREAAPTVRHYGLARAIGDQLRSPLIGILAVGAGASLFLGSPADFALLGITIVANAGIGAWQEHRAARAAELLAQMGASQARVRRDGQPVTVPAHDVVPGDILLLAPGDRVAADARLLAARNLEVDEAALTGESLPVGKAATGVPAAHRIVLEGSDVTMGTGQAVVVAVGGQTQMGATAAALAVEGSEQSPLGERLSRMFRQLLPVAGAAGGIVIGSGLLQGQSLTSQLAVGGSLALAAVPEGVPILAGVGQAAVALRLAGRQALVRRVAAVEALGRVDVACVDKTGTMTEGRLALRLVADPAGETTLPGELSPAQRQVLLTAAIASPHPEAQGARAHQTDVAIVTGAEAAGLGEALRVSHRAEAPFDPARAFHAVVADGCLRVKGAPEAILARCDCVRRPGGDESLDDAGRQRLAETSANLATRGLRVLMVAEGSPDTPVDDPQHLVALGFVGLSDPLRPGVPAAVARCREAGVRVIMLTGDHPATARTIARQAGLLRRDDDGVLTAGEIAALDNGELDQRLARTTVIARATPLDKLRIIESLQRQQHTVAMTGDGVNDAPALRLADVGVAMGRDGTDVARQAADVVLADDNFATLVEALVEGRGFWRNIRRALGLLLGGNLGEVGLVAGATLFGLATPLTARQLLAVNLITDALPGLAIALQQPETRQLAGLAREGTEAFDAALRQDVLRRAIASAAPSLAAYLIALGTLGLPQARTVAAASIVLTQLAQTLEAGRTDGHLSPTVIGAVAGSAGVLAASLTVPVLREFLTLALPAPLGWLLIAAGTLIAVPLGRALPAVTLPKWPAGSATQATGAAG